MLHTHSANQLAELINQFSVPMFAAQRAPEERGFTFICGNTAFLRATGCDPDEFAGQDWRSIFPQNTEEKLTECADAGRDLRCRETWMTPLGQQQWDTVLQPVALPSGADRVICTAFQVTQTRCSDIHHMALDNIRFFSSLADMQLQNLVALFETAQDQGLFNNDSFDRVTRLSCMCRTAQRSVADIKDALRQTHLSPTKATPPLQDPSGVEHDHPPGHQTTRALYDTAREIVFAAE